MAAGENSRDSLGGAGWECAPGEIGWEGDCAGSSHRFSWMSPAPLWRSRNDVIAKSLGDPTNGRRGAWMRKISERGQPNLTVDRSAGEKVSFLVLGDTGEGDESQYAVVPSLLSQAADTDFMFICSDVIYPAGGVGEYKCKFFEPYKEYEKPIYAVPGNHDWYDDCTGFMHWLCAEAEPPPPERLGLWPRRWLRRLLWRRPPGVDPALLKELEDLSSERPASRQPGPYFAIDTGSVLLVGIDTGIRGDIDAEQGEWLKRISGAVDKPKILLTGKPIYVDGKYHPGPIEGRPREETVDRIVTAPENRYIAAIGGDIHNYQRYPVRLEDGRTILYLVSGGGGAFMHETHTIPNIDGTDLAERVREDEFRCYPLRGDSLSRYSKLYARKLGRVGPVVGAKPIPPDVAAAFLADELEIEATRGSARAVSVSAADGRRARVLMKLPARGRGPLHLPFSEWLDWNDPPLFKSFLRIEAEQMKVRIRCFGANGCEAQRNRPPVEDDLVWDGGPGWVLPPS